MSDEPCLCGTDFTCLAVHSCAHTCAECDRVDADLNAYIGTLVADVDRLEAALTRVEGLMLNYATRARGAPTPLAQWKDIAADLCEALGGAP